MNNSFCHLYCGSRHTACYYSPCAVTTNRCGLFARMYRLDDIERQYIVDMHNIFRDIITETFSGGVSNMLYLRYNTALEFVAQCWANMCQRQNDRCRSLIDYQEVGQNIIYLEDIVDPKSVKHLKLAMMTWMDEEDLVPQDAWQKYYDNKDEYTNVTQLLWATSEFVGCGRTKFNKGLFIVCNYAPAGNLYKDPVFLTGLPASQCPEGRNPTTIMKNLCGRTSMVSFEIPFVMSPQYSLASRMHKEIDDICLNCFVTLLMYSSVLFV